MSQSNPTDDKFAEYRGTAGAEVKTADVSSDDHALKQELGNEDDAKERIYDAKIAGERFVQFYDDTAASIREYLSNAETACIRRAKHELKDAGFTDDEIPDETVPMLEMASNETDYEPLVEVTYRRKSDETRLAIEDNGIGISVEEYQVLQRIGYSTSHDEGGRLGNFGMGFMSGFQLTSINGLFKMQTRSYLTDEAYATAEYVANCEFLDDSPDEYGTRFEFPSFGEAAKQIDIPSKVQEFTEGMPVPVLYRDFDESGNETSRSDDFLATVIEESYSDDDLVVTYENEFFKAVMSPSRKVDSRGVVTYNISMPIRRNEDGFGSNKKFNAPWQWDFRGKKENGPIVSCESDESIVGLVPKEDTKYDRLMPEMQEDCIPMSNVPDDAIVMPDPASSRDSFKSGHNDFWRHVSDKMNDEWVKVAAERFESLDSWDQFLGLPTDEKKKLFRAYGAFGPSYTKTEPDTIQETLEENLGVTVPLNLCAKLHESQSTVNVVRRGNSRAHTKGACTSMKIWEVIDRASDGVYMAKTVSQKKADIVWGLGDTDIVRLKNGQSYDDLAADWGWEKAKDLPTRDLEEKLPGLDQDVIDKYDNVSASDSNNTSAVGGFSTGGNGKDPETYRAKVRVSSGSRKYFSTHKVSDLVDALEDDETISAGKFYDGKYLILHDNDTSARDVGSSVGRKDDMVAMRAPKYVYNFLKSKKNVYTSKQAVYDDHAGVDVTLSDGTTMDIRDVPETDMLLAVGSEAEDYFEGRIDDLVELLGYEADDYDRFTFIESSDLDDSWDVNTDAKVVKTSDAASFDDFSDYTYKGRNFNDLKFDDKIGDMDKDSDEYEALFGYRYGNPEGKTRALLIDIAEKAGLTD